jgi:hypothetical protein
MTREFCNRPITDNLVSWASSASEELFDIGVVVGAIKVRGCSHLNSLDSVIFGTVIAGQ